MTLSQTYPQTPVIQFRHGPYDEILPPLLIAGHDPQSAVAKLVADNAALGKAVKVPKFGFSLNGVVNHALQYVHQLRLRDVLAGECEDIVESELYEAVTGRGEPLSMRPPGLEDRFFDSFVPVFQTLTPRRGNSHGPMKWQVGLPGHGRVEVFSEPDPAQAVAAAQRLYHEWAAQDDDAFDLTARDALAGTGACLFHDYWHAQLKADEAWQYGDGFGLRLRGSHTTLELYLPRGMRVIETGHERAVRLVDALARAAGVKANYPSPAEFKHWLDAQPAPQIEAAQWTAGDELGLPCQVRHGGEEYALLRRGEAIALYRVEQGAYTAKIAETTLAGPLPNWLKAKDAVAREVVLRWGFWTHSQSGDAK